MEAMALRRPVITTYVAGIPELVGTTGWLVPAGDVEALTKAIEECLRADSEDLQLLGERAFSVVASRHNGVEDQAARLALLFAELPYGVTRRSAAAAHAVSLEEVENCDSFVFILMPQATRTGIAACRATEY